MFTVIFYTSLILFLLGMLYRIYCWFSRRVGIWAEDLATSNRMLFAVKGISGCVFSSRILPVLKAFVLDVLFQRKILKESFFRWLMHMLIFYGFLLLLLMHALDTVITESLFAEYYSTINPFLFLRDLSGVMVLVGLGMAVYRRFFKKVPRLKTNTMDFYAILILAAIMLSGILLEGLKISAHSEFQRMVEDYAGIDDEQEIEALESLWVKEFGLVSANVKGPFDEDLIETGREVHDANCADCHVSNKWAFTGYAVARMSEPVALALDEAGAIDVMWYIHILLCFVGLAYLPFSKMLHMFATPISLVAGSIMKESKVNRANTVTRQAIELDACTHCGTCSLYCSAMMAFDAIRNEFILPSEKMVFLKRLAAGKPLSHEELSAIREGVYLCTNCDRCTVVCPSGIRLRELWISVREDLVQRGYPEPLILSPLSLVRGLLLAHNGIPNYDKPLQLAQKAVAGKFDTLMDRSKTISLGTASKAPRVVDPTFSYCFGCQNCTTVCPVVGNYDHPQQTLGLLPHQIMCSLGLGQAEMASGASMIWDCVTCYQCQEHCPQNVKVADLMFELKNLAVRNIKK
ncbi:MAG: 4Fe-4S dicluster domain-containing protein [Deltaproteobacteria bacterium]|nr:4Fe-4S dicluster domain-containing protein [Deltaproteobacteria bacterium]